MKFKAISLLSALCIGVFSSSVYAKTTVYTHGLKNGDICEQIAGHWEGNGTVKKLGIKCNYHGVGDMQIIAPGEFSMNISLNKTSGICPAGEQLSFTGTCHNGVVELKTPDADLSGDLTQRGDQLLVDNMKGQVWLLILGIRTSVDVEMSIHKAK